MTTWAFTFSSPQSPSDEAIISSPSPNLFSNFLLQITLHSPYQHQDWPYSKPPPIPYPKSPFWALFQRSNISKICITMAPAQDSPSKKRTSWTPELNQQVSGLEIRLHRSIPLKTDPSSCSWHYSRPSIQVPSTTQKLPKSLVKVTTPTSMTCISSILRHIKRIQRGWLTSSVEQASQIELSTNVYTISRTKAFHSKSQRPPLRRPTARLPPPRSARSLLTPRKTCESISFTKQTDNWASYGTGRWNLELWECCCVYQWYWEGEKVITIVLNEAEEW